MSSSENSPAKPDQAKPDQAKPDQAEPDQAADDDIRRKFREALERKHGRAGSEAAAHPATAPHPHTGAAKPQRAFRRKSG